MRRTVPPSAEIEEQIDQLLAVGVGENPRESLSELAKLGARLIIQRAVEEEFDAWLGRARYERRPECQRGLRNGFRPRKVQTAEGELGIEIPQVREAAEPFVSKLFPRGTKLLRTEPLKALVVGAFVRGLSMRDVESLCEKAGLGKLSKSTASRICQELRERFEQFRRRDLYDIQLAALFLDAVFLSVRPDGPKEGVLVALGLHRSRRTRAALGDARDARIARGGAYADAGLVSDTGPTRGSRRSALPCSAALALASSSSQVARKTSGADRDHQALRRRKPGVTRASRHRTRIDKVLGPIVTAVFLFWLMVTLASGEPFLLL